MKYLLEFAQYLSNDIQDINKDGKKDNPISVAANIGFKNFDPNKVEVIGGYDKDTKMLEELFRTTAGVINEINKLIKEKTEEWYGSFGYQYNTRINPFDIKVGDLIINTEYLMKMVNNRTVFYKICKNEKITNGEDFFNFMKDFSNLMKYYHYEGVFFNEVLGILISTTRKGNKGENASLGYFKWFMDVKGYTISIVNPTLEEDIRGIDGKFNFNGVEKTIQVKPYENFIIEDKVGTATSNGSLTLNTDVLILYKEDPLKKDVFRYIIAKKNNVKIVGNNFILTKWDAKGEKTK
jgi:hypothetical protein